MSGSKHIDVICLIITLVTVAATLLFINGGALGLTPADSGSEYFTGADLDGDWDASMGAGITLDGDDTAASGGAYYAQGVLHILSAGRYVLSGELRGCVSVESTKSSQVWLMLDGADIENPAGPAIIVEQADKVFITLAAGSENSVTSGSFQDAESGADGAIYSRDDLTVNGGGSLTVTSAGHGVVCNDSLAVTGGRIDITAAVDGIHANDSVSIRSADITIQAGDDGVTVSNDENTGSFYIESGTLSVPRCYEGVEAAYITAAGGTMDLRPTDDGLNANVNGASVITVEDGASITVINETGRDADGFDSNGSIYINGGYVMISVNASGGSCALDAGTESGGVCLINGGTVIAAGSSGMAEGFDRDSGQGFIMESVSGGQGARVTLSGDAGQLLDCEVPLAFSSLILSCPGLAVGDTVTLSVDGAESRITVDNSGSQGFGGFGGFGGQGHLGGWNGGMAGGAQTPPEGGDAEQGQDGAGGRFGARPDRGDRGDIGGTTAPDGDMSGEEGPFAGMMRPGGDMAGGDMTGGFKGGNRGMIRDQTAAAQEPAGSGISGGAVAAVAVSALALCAGLALAWRVKH